MSFYCRIDLTGPLDLEAVKEGLPFADVGYGWIDNRAVFYREGESVRGVLLYVRAGAIELGLNAFSSVEDAELFTALVRVFVETIGGVLKLETIEKPMSSRNLHDRFGAQWEDAIFDKAWFSERAEETVTLLGMLPDEADDAMHILGHHIDFSISKAFLSEPRLKSKTPSQIAHELLDEAKELQAFAGAEGTYCPDLVNIVLKPKRVKAGMLGLLLPKAPAQNVSFFLLHQGLRTITPNPIDQCDVVLKLGSESRYLPYERFIEVVKDHAHRTFFIKNLDITLQETTYHMLFDQAQAQPRQYTPKVAVQPT